MTLSVRLAHRFADFSLDVDFAAPDGITALFGRSGSGKTTIARAVAGLLRPASGRVEIDGRVLLDTGAGICLPPHRRRVGYIFQEARLFPHLSVSGNLDYGARLARQPLSRAERARIVEMLGIGALLEARPGRLSGGEAQRVAIGRALMAAPDVILADEPLSSLDEPRKAEILPYFERLRDAGGVPILYVSHSVAEVARLATTVVALREGRVLGQGPALELLGDPEVQPTGVRDAGAVIEAVVRAHHDDGLAELDAGGVALFLPGVSAPPGTPLRVRISAQEVILSRGRPEGLSALNILPGRVSGIRRGDGPGAIVSVATPAGTILARVTARSVDALGLGEGATCHAIVKSVAIAPGDLGGASSSGGRSRT